MSPDGKIGRTNRAVHTIDTGNAKPIKIPHRRVSPKMQEIIDKEIDKMLEQDIIEESNSPWSASLVVVFKKDGTPRICVDYSETQQCDSKR